MPDVLEILIPCMIGLGLAAACGFRVFVPMLIIGIAGRTDYLSVAEGFEWLESWPAIIALGVATLLEVGAYYFPWLDNLLDTVSTPAAVIAGVIVSAAVTHADMNPLLKWSVGVIAGGGSAGIVKFGFNAIRAGSSVTTAGIANPIVSTVEWIGSLLMSILAVFLPVIAAVLAGVSVIASAMLLRRIWKSWRASKRDPVKDS